MLSPAGPGCSQLCGVSVGRVLLALLSQSSVRREAGGEGSLDIYSGCVSLPAYRLGSQKLLEKGSKAAPVAGEPAWIWGLPGPSAPLAWLRKTSVAQDSGQDGCNTTPPAPVGSPLGLNHLPPHLPTARSAQLQEGMDVDLGRAWRGRRAATRGERLAWAASEPQQVPGGSPAG